MIVLLPDCTFHRIPFNGFESIRNECDCRLVDCISPFYNDLASVDMWFDDEYGFTDKPINLIASGLALSAGCSCFEGFIRGTVVFTACDYATGDSRELNEIEEKIIISTLKRIGGQLIKKEMA